MIFKIALYLSLFICMTGLIYRITAWFRKSIGPDISDESPWARAIHAGKAVLSSLTGRKILLLCKTLIVNILLQGDLFKAHKFRWLCHILLLYSFLLLILMHAMDDIVSRTLFSNYEPTLNPFLFLRNFFGAIVLSGILFFIARRAGRKIFRKSTNASDIIAITLLLVIIFSGFLLEAVQIISAPVFDEMVVDYMGSDDEEELASLKVYWAREYGVVFSEKIDYSQTELFSKGAAIHEESCSTCHARPSNAFISYPLSRILHAVAVFLNSVRADIWLWHVHYLVCFIGLAILPFTKFFHLISVPLNLLVQSGRSISMAEETSRSVKRAIGMDACTHCGICSSHCSVMPVYRVTANPNVLPSEKLLSAKAVASGRQLDRNTCLAIAAGNHACTDCYRCTQVCPSGIDLHDLWQASRKEMEKRQYAAPDQWIRWHSASQWAVLAERRGGSFSPDPDEYLLRNMTPESFSNCVQCTVCANVCPVVSLPDELDSPEMTPQQVMNLLRLDMKDLAMASRMVWDCMTCYMCQEHCPQGIRVADILYELRNIGARRLQKVGFSED